MRHIVHERKEVRHSKRVEHARVQRAVAFAIVRCHVSRDQRACAPKGPRIHLGGMCVSQSYRKGIVLRHGDKRTMRESRRKEMRHEEKGLYSR